MGDKEEFVVFISYFLLIVFFIGFVCFHTIEKSTEEAYDNLLEIEKQIKEQQEAERQLALEEGIRTEALVIDKDELTEHKAIQRPRQL